MLKRIGVTRDQYQIVKGSEIQLCAQYMLNLLKFSTIVNSHAAKRAGTEMIKKSDNTPKMSALIYPLMQALDENALGADVQLGGRDQRKIFTLSLDYIEKLGSPFKKCSYLINPLIPSLVTKGEKMSASNENGKITFLDSIGTITKKVRKSFCQETISDIGTNAPLAIMKLIVFPILGSIIIYRPVKWGGNVTFETFESLEQDWIDGNISAADLKLNLADYIEIIIKPVRDALKNDMQLYRNAYGESV